MKNRTDCGDATEELVECARRRAEPDLFLRKHLNSCAVCAERWDAERSLTTGLRILRIQASSGRSPETVRTALLREFAVKKPKSGGNRWFWTLAAAAVLMISALLMRDFVAKPSITAALADEQNDSQQEGFIAVPYAPPLAQGELVRVVHTELQPAALASLGVNVDPSWTTELPADLLVGQDGFPRAVRVSNEYSGEGGF